MVASTNVDVNGNFIVLLFQNGWEPKWKVHEETFGMDTQNTIGVKWPMSDHIKSRR